MSWARHGADLREAQAAANRPMFVGALGQTYLPAPRRGRGRRRRAIEQDVARS